MNKQEKLEFLKRMTAGFYTIRTARQDFADPVTKPNKEGGGWEVFSGIKPSGYYVPQMIFSSKEVNKGVKNAWFVEIWIENICIFRTSLLPYDDEQLEDLEEEALNKAIEDVFRYGLGSAWKFHRDYKKVDY